MGNKGAAAPCPPRPRLSPGLILGPGREQKDHTEGSEEAAGLLGAVSPCLGWRGGRGLRVNPLGPSAELALCKAACRGARARGWAALPSRHQTETGQIPTGRLWRHERRVGGGAASWTRGLRPRGLPGKGPPRRLRGSCHAQFCCPERRFAAVGEPPLGRLRLRRLGGLPLPVIRGLQQLQHPPHLEESKWVGVGPAPHTCAQRERRAGGCLPLRSRRSRRPRWRSAQCSSSGRIWGCWHA